MAHSIATLERIRARLAALPKPERHSRELNKQQSIGFLAKDLAASLRDGHTLDELVSVFAAEGIGLTAVALKSHLRRVRRAGPKRKRGRANTRVSSRNSADATDLRAPNPASASTPARVAAAQSLGRPPGMATSAPASRPTPSALPPPRPGMAPTGPALPHKESDKP